MIKEKTVFILGAGASCPYGFPDGRKLREEIIDNFVSDSIAYFRTQGGRELKIFKYTGKHEAETFVDKFDKSSTKSIDLFLARNPEFTMMGKHAIIFRILAAESKSKFREKVEDTNKDWYSYLLYNLTDELVRKDDYARFSENKVSFITFNYDRALEHFLYESLTNSFNNIALDKIKEQIDSLSIIHVFGQVSGLDWQDLESKVEYKRDFKFVNVGKLVKDLKIIYEDNDNPILNEAHKLISEAENIFFLGFGYAKENLGLLRISEILKIGQNIYGTALEMTENEIKEICSIFPNKHPPYASCVHINNADCLMVLRNYL